jgi:hypothetical protein
MCTRQSHEDLKLDRGRYLAETTLVGYQELGDGTESALRNCHGCGSSLMSEHVDDTRYVLEDARAA